MVNGPGKTSSENLDARAQLGPWPIRRRRLSQGYCLSRTGLMGIVLDWPGGLANDLWSVLKQTRTDDFTRVGFGDVTCGIITCVLITAPCHADQSDHTDRVLPKHLNIEKLLQN